MRVAVGVVVRVDAGARGVVDDIVIKRALRWLSGGTTHQHDTGRCDTLEEKIWWWSSASQGFAAASSYLKHRQIGQTDTRHSSGV